MNLESFKKNAPTFLMLLTAVVIGSLLANKVQMQLDKMKTGL